MAGSDGAALLRRSGWGGSAKRAGGVGYRGITPLKMTNASIRARRLTSNVVRKGGFEPPRLSAHGPKPCASAVPPLPRGTSVPLSDMELALGDASGLHAREVPGRHVVHG